MRCGGNRAIFFLFALVAGLFGDLRGPAAVPKWPGRHDLFMELSPLSSADIAISPVYAIGSIYLAALFIGVIMDIVLFFRVLSQPWSWENMARRIRAGPWRPGDAAWIFVLLILIQLSAGLIHWGGIKLGWFAADAKDTAAALVQGLLFHGIALLIVCWFIRRRNISWNEAFGMGWRNLKPAAGRGLAGYLGIIPIVFFTSFLCQLFLYAAGYPVTLQDVVAVFMEPQSGWSLFFLLLLAVVVAPVVEETLFRGILLPVLMKKTGPGAAVVISSALFALVHQHLPSFAPLFVLAVVLSMLYISSGSLWTPIVLHSVFNGVSICILLLAMT
ncbi:MAG: type II CAAX endopeptidase family protein [Kiritimatiellae bacterium]|nr:type II CAAX endopeptidase family protein [Kiritimatiellia bacterium]